MNAPLRKARPYIFWGQTQSLCETCLTLVPTKIQISGNEVWYEKRCKQHGVQSTLVSTDQAYWRLCKDFIKPGDRPLAFQRHTEFGCPYDCGLCPDHEQHSCLALIEITEHCNLTCPVCFADSSPARSSFTPLAKIETLHPDFFAILDAVRARPIRHVMINTNGLRIAREPDFVAKLAANKRGLEVYLQFDSLKREALVNLRGADLRKIRQQALENLERYGVSTTLVATIKRGVNDADIGDIIRHALTWKCVRGVTLQPVQDAGRNEAFNKDTDRIMLSEIRQRVIETGVFGDKDMIPLPCNPESVSIGYGLRSGDKVLPLTSLIPQEQLVAVMPNTISPEKYPVLREKFVDLFSLSSGPLNTSERVCELLCCLPSFEVPEGLTYENVFRVTIVQFLDRFNFCVGNVKRSCIHFVTESGAIIPFDTYNLFYRDGKIDGIRASLAGQTSREARQGEEVPR
jgi:uncharacterized radical SAM superfamily Fe-S cluster-containing enzyme